MIYSRVFVPLRNRQFFDIHSLNEAIKTCMLKHNQTRTQPYEKRTRIKPANCGANILETSSPLAKTKRKALHVVLQLPQQERSDRIHMVMNKAYKNFIEEAVEAIRNFPDLQLNSREDSLPFLEGKITLLDEHGVAYDAYQLKIDCSDDYHNSFPIVYETAERLPHNIDWHVYEDGHFCICTPIEEYIHCSKGITLTTLIQNHVLHYLHNQSFREKEGYFLHERSHGTPGILESIQGVLKVKDLNKIYSLLVYVYKNDTPSRTSMCFCGSGKKYRYCHREAYLALKDIGQKRLFQIIYFLKDNI